MSDDRDKLLQVMSSLESDYRSGKISKEKYSYFRSKYEDKLNSIDAMEATRRIRSMQGKSTAPTQNGKRNKKPAVDKKKHEQDLVQKYIINPKKGDAKYNKKKKTAMDSGTFRLILLLILVIGFTAGVAYGVFNFDFETGTDTTSVGIVEDTAFPEITVVVTNVTNNISTNTSNTTVLDTTTDDTNNDDNNDNVETTRDDSSKSSQSSSSQSQSSSSQQSSSQSDSGQQSSSSTDSGSSDSSPSSTDSGGSSSDAGSDGGSSE